MTAVGTICTLL